MNEPCPRCASCQPVPLPVVAYALAPDLLRGAEEISEFLYGTRLKTRQVYHLAETSQIPIFRLGSMLHARRTVLMAWIEAQEQRGMQGLIRPSVVRPDA